MSFATGHLDDPAKNGPGERFGTTHLVLTATTFEDGLLTGRFAKEDTGSIDNMDGSATPVIAGVVMRKVSMPVEDNNAINTALYDQIEYARQGLMTVRVKTGETPALFGRVFASNAGDADDGLALTSGGIDVNAEFIEEVSPDVWLVYLTPAPGDVATHIADAVGAHAASAISVLDAGGFTAQIEVEAALAELFPHASVVVADPGDAGAIPVARTSTVAITTGGAGETRTLAIPSFAGQQLHLSFDVDGGGDAVVTAAAAVNQAGNTSLTFAAAGDALSLAGVTVGGALVWRVLANDGVVLA